MTHRAQSRPARIAAPILAVLAVSACGLPPTAPTTAVTPTTSAPPHSPSLAPTPRPIPTEPVLGAAAFEAPYGSGFGTYKPAKIDNGGDPSGRVVSITWTDWGGGIAFGTGTTDIAAVPPDTGYVGPRVAELRASDLGPCTLGGPLAYRHLEVREPDVPGGPLGPWSVWNDADSICTR